MFQETTYHGYKENSEPTDWAENMPDYLQDYREFFKQDLIAQAAEARDWAVSHRQPMFQVGCSIMTKPGDPREPENDYRVFTGYNYKPKPGPPVKGSQKRCAERRAVEQAIDNGTELIVAMVTVSRETSTGDATHAHDALHPCADCRAMMRALLEKGILRADSIMCNVNDSKKDKDGKWVEEERTVEKLLALYEDEILPRAA
jgi:cytidine deaminase